MMLKKIMGDIFCLSLFTIFAALLLVDLLYR